MMLTDRNQAGLGVRTLTAQTGKSKLVIGVILSLVIKQGPRIVFRALLANGNKQMQQHGLCTMQSFVQTTRYMRYPRFNIEQVENPKTFGGNIIYKFNVIDL